MQRGAILRALYALAFFTSIGVVAPARAHNGVKLEQDPCVFSIGPETMHFSAYQRKGEEEEFCEDIAQSGPTVIALSTVSADARDMAIGLRIVKASSGSDEGQTVAEVEPKVYRNGIFTYEYDFKDAGRYAAVVTMADEAGNKWVARFPFSVGVYTFWNMIEYILYAVAFLSLAAFLWWFVHLRSLQKTRKVGALAHH